MKFSNKIKITNIVSGITGVVLYDLRLFTELLLYNTRPHYELILGLIRTMNILLKIYPLILFKVKYSYLL